MAKKAAKPAPIPTPGTHHVVSNPKRGGWDIIRGGSSRPSGHYATKQEAIAAGKKLCQSQGTKLVVHRAGETAG
ncbi:MAG: DUF2188 domain-containing protein [Planctomycetota bacterium]|jgi:hypothetical protein|nr:DUF2188 domain-containing protein [Planctomycetota bacterium]